MGDAPAIQGLLRRPEGPTASYPSRLVGDQPSRSPWVPTPASAAPAESSSGTTPSDAPDWTAIAAQLAAAVATNSAIPPANSRPYRIGGTFTDAAPANGTTGPHAIASAVIPKGFRFFCRRRLSILDTTAGGVRGGVTVTRSKGVIYDGAAPMDGVTANEPGEFLGATGLDQDFFFVFEPNDAITMTASLVRGGTAVSCAIHGALVGYLLQVQ